MTEELSVACQQGKCGDCAYNDDEFAALEPDWCLCEHHIDDPGDDIPHGMVGDV